MYLLSTLLDSTASKNLTKMNSRIVPSVSVPQTVLISDMKEVVADPACCGAWVNRTPKQAISTGVGKSTPCNVCNHVSIKQAPSPFPVGMVSIYPPCGLSWILQVDKKRQYTSPGLGGKTQKLDAVIDGNFPDDLNSVSIFSKLIGHKLSDGSSGEL